MKVRKLNFLPEQPAVQQNLRLGGYKSRRSAAVSGWPYSRGVGGTCPTDHTERDAMTNFQSREVLRERARLGSPRIVEDRRGSLNFYEDITACAHFTECNIPNSWLLSLQLCFIFPYLTYTFLLPYIPDKFL